jgi:hypothetical protein
LKIAVYWGDAHTLPGKCDDNTWYSFYNSGWKYGFEKLGHQVDYFAWDDSQDRQGYDLYIYAPGFLTNLTMKPKIYSPNIFFTEEVSVSTGFAVGHAYHYDNLCFLDYMNFKALRSLGLRNIWWVPGAVDPTVFKDFGQSRQHNCVFLGNFDNTFFIENGRTRLDYIKTIDKMPTSIVARGYYAFEANKIWNSGKIGIDVPLYEFCSFRLMQIIAAGNFCLTRQTRINSGIQHILQNDDYDTYHNLEELRDKTVPFWLNNFDEMKVRNKKAKERVMSLHTFEHRAKQLLQIARLQAREDKLFFCEENL